jgi:hypothetical protein
VVTSIRRVAISLISSAVLAAGVVALQASSGTAMLAAPCWGRAVCSYEHIDYAGSVLTQPAGVDSLYFDLRNQGWNDRISSIMVNGSCARQGKYCYGYFYWDINWGGKRIVLASADTVADLRTWDWNDRISSLDAYG